MEIIAAMFEAKYEKVMQQMAYLALYREWRPRQFKDIVGQEHVTKTLMNALSQGKIAHAYLFSGPRGTGKTTAAKVLAKSLNCKNRTDFEPCNECESCASIDQGSAIEVFEIDAASNRGIDEIRDLRENVKLSAPQGKYKVYIIDEVHMLTTEAFNALLKTLEEPPQRVVFILATTEPHKIPLTILSRVQRFEFHRISVEDIQQRLNEVCKALQREVDSAALLVIAQKSEGGLRDALSILDQCLLLDDPLGVEEVYQVLGMVGETFSAKLIKAISATDYGETLSNLAEGIRQGRDPRQILRELLDYLRQMLLYLATHQPPLIAPNLREELIQVSEQAGLKQLLKWIAVLLQGEGQLKYAGNARLAVELLLVQAIYEGQGNSQVMDKGIEERLQEIENEIRQKSFSDKKGKEQTFQEVNSKNNKENKTQEKNIETLPVADNSPKKTEKGFNQSLTLEQVQAKWPEILENVRRSKRSTHAFLLEGKPCNLQGNVLTLEFTEGFSFHKDKVSQPENKNTIENILQQLFGVKITLHNIMENERNNELPPEDDNEGEALINKAKDIFGADRVIVKNE